MIKRKIFFSFDYEEDVFRVQQIRNMGIIEHGETLVTANKWEEIKRGGNEAIRRWIDINISYCSCLVVLIGQYTLLSDWVVYEIKKAWNEGKGVLGIYVHNLKCPRNGICPKGQNLFEHIFLDSSDKAAEHVPSVFSMKPLSFFVKSYDPSPFNPYNDISKNLENWVEDAIRRRN